MTKVPGNVCYCKVSPTPNNPLFTVAPPSPPGFHSSSTCFPLSLDAVGAALDREVAAWCSRERRTALTRPVLVGLSRCDPLLFARLEAARSGRGLWASDHGLVEVKRAVDGRYHLPGVRGGLPDALAKQVNVYRSPGEEIWEGALDLARIYVALRQMRADKRAPETVKEFCDILPDRDWGPSTTGHMLELAATSGVLDPGPMSSEEVDFFHSVELAIGRNIGGITYTDFAKVF